MKIINNIETIMKNKGITAYKLEKDTGIKQSTFSHWKAGSQPPADKLEEIISYLKVTPNEIFGYNVEKDPITAPKLTENEKELLKYFRMLPDREQIKLIVRAEDKAEQYNNPEQKFTNSGENNQNVG